MSYEREAKGGDLRIVLLQRLGSYVKIVLLTEGARFQWLVIGELAVVIAVRQQRDSRDSHRWFTNHQ